jgi:hypothetical protein
MLFVCNPTEVVYPDTPVFVVLDVFGSYYFAPDFSSFDRYIRTIEFGKMTIEVLPEFSWPSGVGSASGLMWYAAMTDPGMTSLLGELGTFYFGWHE